MGDDEEEAKGPQRRGGGPSKPMLQALLAAFGRQYLAIGAFCRPGWLLVVMLQVFMVRQLVVFAQSFSVASTTEMQSYTAVNSSSGTNAFYTAWREVDVITPKPLSYGLLSAGLLGFASFCQVSH